ncbi:cell agglutination protein Mam3 [Malassezia cuniculi]|uniref:Cell agglutination protein Mam3 n=1 Tax=Malassezia cuniculi TaxID=948313 RepID=A0AAF0J4L8_9BASI|nr:cell agglutination protein Mam3 [Malassezia cuniculi]
MAEQDGASHGGPVPAEPKTPLRVALDLTAIFGLVVLGGIFAGLTLGLMGLDMVNLQVLSSSGTEEERKNANTVLRLLERGRHWVLVVLLLGNVIVNETLPIFLSEFGSGLSAVIISTVLIVIFGEIVPQSICARYGLLIGAKCAPLVHVAMIIMAPIAYPTAKLLDYCLGEEHGTTYRKAELKTFVSLHQQIGTEQLNEDEVTIIRAVLELNDKTLKDVMTPIEDVFTLPSDHILDQDAVEELVKLGYSRVPIHAPNRPDAILGMLLVKRLIQYDPEDSWPVSRFTLTPLPEASPELNLLDAINYMQVGRSHMILVSQHPGEATGALGVVTLEDIIEEMIGEEIVDETDVFVDVHNKVKVERSKPMGNNAQEQWQPLIRGIIERRRKYGGPAQLPLHSSFGTYSKRDNVNRGARQGKYGLLRQCDPRDKVSIKDPMSSLRNYGSVNTTPNSPRFGESSDSNALSLSYESTGDQKSRRWRDRLYSNSSMSDAHSTDDEGVREPYIVEMGGSHGHIPHVITVADISKGNSDRALAVTAAADMVQQQSNEPM